MRIELHNELKQDLQEAVQYLVKRNANALLAIILEVLDILKELMEVDDDNRT